MAKAIQKASASRNGRRRGHNNSRPEEQEPVSQFYKEVKPFLERAWAEARRHGDKPMTRRQLERYIEEIRNG